MLVIAATLFGIFAVLATPREENPRITVPTAIVTTDAPGRSRDEVLRLVTLPLERVIGQIAGVEHVYDSSQYGRSTITVRYRVGTDTTNAYVDLYTRLLGNRNVIPSDAAAPVVTRCATATIAGVRSRRFRVRRFRAPRARWSPSRRSRAW